MLAGDLESVDKSIYDVLVEPDVTAESAIRPTSQERLDVLDRRINEMGLEMGPYGWYRDLRRYGTVPHAGFGLGFDRALAYATGMANIRDVIPFPRTPGSAEF